LSPASVFSHWWDMDSSNGMTLPQSLHWQDMPLAFVQTFVK
jgi:hypothetical protein